MEENMDYILDDEDCYCECGCECDDCCCEDCDCEE